MLSILMALTLVGLFAQEYLFKLFVKERSARHSRLKTSSASLLLLMGLIQVWIQHNNEDKTEKDTEFLKAQLTNALESVRGMSDGGTAWAVLGMGITEGKTNWVNFSLWSTGEYPLRNVYVKVQDETKRIEAQLAHASNSPPSVPVCEKRLGDIPRGQFSSPPEICSVQLDPAVTNHIRFDIVAMNGFSWEIQNIWKVTNGWQTELHYRLKRLVGQKAVVEPSRWKDALLVY